MKILSKLLSIIITIILIPIHIVVWIFIFLRANFGRNRVSIDEFDVKANPQNIQIEDGIVSIDADDFTPEEVNALKEKFSSLLELPEHKAIVKHVYTLDFTNNEGRCPRCDSATEQRNATFVYDAGPEIRAMYLPAGYFCLNCPTVIVDTDMMKKSVAKNHRFETLIGIDFENQDDTNFFNTFNGETAIYTDESDQSIFIPEFADMSIHTSSSTSKKNNKKSKRKSKKTARKKNRSKK